MENLDNKSAAWNCPGCGKINDSDARFCEECGTPKPAATNNISAAWNCPGCGKINDSDARFCEECGTPKPAATQQIIPDTPPVITNPPEAASAVSVNIKKTLPFVAAGAVGIAALVLIITFIVSASAKLPAIAAHSAQQQELEAEAAAADSFIQESGGFCLSRESEGIFL